MSGRIRLRITGILMCGRNREELAMTLCLRIAMVSFAALALSACASSVAPKGDSLPARSGTPAGHPESKPLPPLPAERTINAGPAMDLGKAEAFGQEVLAKEFGNPTRRTRSIIETTSQLKTRGELFSSLDSRMPGSVYFIEYEGSFQGPPSRRGIRGEVLQFAALVIDPRDGTLLSRTLYSERFRPR